MMQMSEAFRQVITQPRRMAAPPGRTPSTPLFMCGVAYAPHMMGVNIRESTNFERERNATTF
jgi:hypothetical protein